MFSFFDLLILKPRNLDNFRLSIKKIDFIKNRCNRVIVNE